MKKRSTFSRILSFVLKYPFSTLGSLLCAVVTVVASLLVPVYFGDAIDYIVESGVDFVGLKAVLAKTAGAAAVAAAVCMGLSRLYVGVHYPSDVLVGALVGSLCGLAACRLVNEYERRRTLRR